MIKCARPGCTLEFTKRTKGSGGQNQKYCCDKCKVLDDHRKWKINHGGEGYYRQKRSIIKCARYICCIRFEPTMPHHIYCSEYCRISEKSKRRWRDNRDTLRATHKRWVARHQEEHKIRKRISNQAYQIRYKERLRQKAKEYYNKNIEICRGWRINNQVRRRILKNNTRPELAVTPLDWILWKEAFGYKCAYCGLHTLALTQDHVIPLCKGGQHTLDNILPACKSCNCRKGSKSLEEFLSILNEQTVEVDEN